MNSKIVTTTCSKIMYNNRLQTLLEYLRHFLVDSKRIIYLKCILDVYTLVAPLSFYIELALRLHVYIA